ncbi:MAG: periplasmic heavy metal sensor [Candidatus Marinimicrobia bacterium]|nr:periplasmic heavy metal sensor [Candidatus Neomarinimicrobiota bacterium]MCF7828946.1 periplasmic heavy metal sensor [Candidatus Neomarinimicrobiota bacterium]MCF7879906.1 periplasmic heavy metal sensor [Candidatus Neomarinimicrobiota bacterium]
MKKSQWFVTGAFVMFLLPAMVLGQFGPRHDMKMEALDLSAEQQEQLESLAVEHHKEMIAARADLKIARLELQELLVSGVSEKKVNSQVNAVAEAEKAILQNRIAHQLAVREALGEEAFGTWMRMHHRGQCGNCGPGKHRGMQGRSGKMGGQGMRQGMQ